MILLDKHSLLAFSTDGVDWSRLSDHNRAALSIVPERIERTVRTANGNMRKFWVADKRTFSTSWSMLPGRSTHTADGFWGAEDIRDFYYDNPQEFMLKVATNMPKEVEDDPEHPEHVAPKIYTVHFSSFSAELLKRWNTTYWDLSLDLEEI